MAVELRRKLHFSILLGVDGLGRKMYTVVIDIYNPEQGRTEQLTKIIMTEEEMMSFGQMFDAHRNEVYMRTRDENAQMRERLRQIDEKQRQARLKRQKEYEEQQRATQDGSGVISSR